MSQEAQRPARLLLIDDDPGVRGLLVRTLAAEGYEVVATATVEEALSEAGQGRPGFDLVVADLGEARARGWKLYDRLREEGAIRRALLVSGAAPHGAADRLAEPGCRFLHKPFSIQALGDAVAELLAVPTDPEPTEE